MAAIPTLEAEDARRPSREHEALVGERTRVINRMKSALARLGVRDFKPTLRGPAPAKAGGIGALGGAAHAGGIGIAAQHGGRVAPRHRPSATGARLQLVKAQIAEIERTRLERLRQPSPDPAQGMVGLLARVVGIGIETADMLVQEVLTRKLRDRRAVARGACPRAGRGPDPGGGLTGAPEESGARRRQKGLARAGNARVRRGMLQLAWRFLMFQKDSMLAQWFRVRTADARGATRKTMIPAFARTALARKLLIALWRLVTTGEVPQGVVLRPVA